MTKFEKDQIKDMVKSHEFLSGNATLESAYLLGMLSAAVVNWQYGALEDFLHWSLELSLPTRFFLCFLTTSRYNY